jgi:transcription-repair coupling factor (superfamily II helicase)
LEKLNIGHMASIGYELYVSMLERAIKKEKEGITEEIEIAKEVKIDLGVSAYIPDSYISNLMTKISIYHKISDAINKDMVLDLVDELLDRFGDLPKEVDNLIKIVEIRNKCKLIGITKVYINNDYLILQKDLQELKYFIKSKDILMFTQFVLDDIIKMMKLNNI